MRIRAVLGWLGRATKRKGSPAETSATLAVWFNYALGAELKPPGTGEEGNGASLSKAWSWVQQPCMNVAEESCCPQRFPSPNAWHGSVFVWLEASRSVLGTPAAGQCRVAACSLHSRGWCRSIGNWKKGDVSWRGRTDRKVGLGQVTGVLCAGQGGIPGWKVCFHVCFVPSLPWRNIVCSPLQPPAPHPSPGSSHACPSSLPVCPRAARGEPEGQGQTLSPQAGSRALQKPAAGSPPVGPAAASSHCSALHFPALLAASPYSISLTPYPSLPLSLHLISSISPSAPSSCALAAAPSCCAGWELPFCSSWGGFGWLLGGALHPWQAPASPWGWQSPTPSIQPQQHMPGGTALRWLKGKGRLRLSSARQSGDHQPRAQASAACGLPRGACAQGRRDTSL